jgi:hypothetical protein
VNLCGSCGGDFSSVEVFDRHRVGVHAYTFSGGMAMKSPREDGRRCLDVDEMEGRGWARNERGRWNDPARSTRLTRAALRQTPKLREAA